MGGRANQAHTLATARIDASVNVSQFADAPVSRSSKSVEDLSRIMTKLMAMSPARSLFACSTCMGVDNSCRIHALCVDGVWKGYNKKSRKKFQNISEPCKAQSVSSAATARAPMRPLERLIRREQTSSILLVAVTGSLIHITQDSVKAATGAIKIVRRGVLPPDFYDESVCGSSSRLFANDLGENCTLCGLRSLTQCLFIQSVLLYRILRAMLHCFKKTGQKQSKKKVGKGQNRKTTRTTSQNYSASQSVVVLTSALFAISTEDSSVESFPEDAICWVDDIKPISNVLPNTEVFLLYKGLIQGPATHFSTRQEIPSLHTLSTLCLKADEAELKMCLGNPSALMWSAAENVASVVTNNALSNLRLLVSGLFSGLVLQDRRNKAVHSNVGVGLGSVVNCFGRVLQENEKRVREFYQFYDTFIGGQGSASQYAMKWKSTDRSELQQRMLDEYHIIPNSDQQKNHFDIACASGTYFPCFPQVRPLPFNDELKEGVDDSKFGFCSKAYLQKKTTFTPGALTFCCSCPSPIILGFKVLEKNEGPRAVLDIIVSRFLEVPRFLIYDFGCGVYNSAVHTLWWAIEDSTVVSDDFHGGNHSCSPAFLPTSHNLLNGTNTVAHEQRNRAITSVVQSLRHMSHKNYIALLSVQATILNIQAKAKASPNFSARPRHVGPRDIDWLYFHCLGLNCPCCVTPGPQVVYDLSLGSKQ